MALMQTYLDYTDIAFTLVIWRAYTFYRHLVVSGPNFPAKTGKATRDTLVHGRR